MRKEAPEVVSYPFMEELGIAPIELDPETMDLRPEFRTKLRELLKSGWNPDARMVIAKSKEARLNGQLLQGRHRCLEIGELLKDGFPFDTSKILFSYKRVNDADEFRTLRSAYELAATTAKDQRKSKALIRADISTVVKNRYDEDDSKQNKTLEFLRSKGFTDDNLSREIINNYMESLKKKADKKRKKPPGAMSSIPGELRDRKAWNLQEELPFDEDTTAFLREVKFRCERCNHENVVKLNIQVGDNRDLRKLELAKVPVKR
jgi:hypothetical protein